MKRIALSIKQPWAHLIISGAKPVENRTWTTAYRGLLYIHAAKRWRGSDCDLVHKVHGVRVDFGALRFGGIIGMVELYDIVTHDASHWFYGPYGWKLRNPQPLPFLPLRGHQNIFTF